MIELLKYILFGTAFWVTPEPVDLYAGVPCVIDVDLSAINNSAYFSIDITHLIDSNVVMLDCVRSEQASLFKEVDVFIDAYYDDGVVRFYYNGSLLVGNDYVRIGLRPDVAGRFQVVGKKINQIKIFSNKDLLDVRVRWANGHL